MLSCPRFEVYSHLPLGWRAISAASLRPEKSGGNAEISWMERNDSRASFESTVTLDFISPSTYKKLPSRENTAWRGPVPGASIAVKASLVFFTVPAFVVAEELSPGVREPFASSNL